MSKQLDWVAVCSVVFGIVVTAAHQERRFVDVNPGLALERGETALAEQLVLEEFGGVQYQRVVLGRRVRAVEALTIQEVLFD